MRSGERSVCRILVGEACNNGSGHRGDPYSSVSCCAASARARGAAAQIGSRVQECLAVVGHVPTIDS